MKNLKKILASLTAVFMMLVCVGTVTASADGQSATATHSIVLDKAVSGHTYTAYKIFGGTTTSANSNALASVTWGDGLTTNGKRALAKAVGLTVTGENEPDAQAVYEALADITDAASIAKLLSEGTTTEGYPAPPYITGGKTGTFGTGDNASKYTINGLTTGYYLITDTNDNADLDETMSLNLLKVVGNTEFTLKNGEVTVEKKVKDINDSTDNAKSDWQDSADHDIDDVIDYKITGTLPDNYDKFNTYKYVFTDTISKGLTIPTDENDDTKPTGVAVKVYNKNADGNWVEGDNITTSFKISLADYSGDDSTYTGGKVLTISCLDLKLIQSSGLTNNSQIVVTYTATLNSNANIGYKGNPNKVDLEYSHNPNDGGSGTKKTKEDTVIVFTYEVDVNKVTGTGTDQTSLPGAGFTLSKWDKATFTWKTVKVIADGTTTLFQFSGIDDGYYKLEETTVPDGYNKADDVTFAVVADHPVTSDTPSLTSLSVKSLTVTESEGTTTFTVGTNANTDFTVKMTEATDGKYTGFLDTTVVNNTGSTLPETGGMGTTLLYVAGGILILGAAIFFVTNKRMQRN